MATRVDDSKATASARHSLCRTTFLVPNLHCPSCVSHIEESLLSLQPKPSSISHSIVSHSVTVYHDPSLLVPTISKALEGAGYEVYDVIADPPPTDTSPSNNATNAENRSTQSQWFERAIQIWKTKGGDVQEEGGKRRKRHVEHCDMCRAEEKADAKETLSPSSTEDEKVQQDTVDWRVRKRRPNTDASIEEQKKGDPFVVVESDFSQAKIFQASISITGMTCSSCVGKITRALEAKPWIHSVDVSLLTNSASVRFGGEEYLKELANIIDSVGYEATVEQVDEIVSPKRTGSRATSDVWRASYAIGGMTCSSCVGNITKSLKGYPWIRTVDVNLITNSATVVFEGKDRLRDIQAAIEDVGYEAKLDDVVDLSRDQAEDMRRTVAIRVDGMYCEHCPARIQDALREFDQRVAIESASTTDDPILKLAYIPHSPDFTIRHILGAISAVDAAFTPSVFHPPTMEERSRMMHAREQKRILFRVSLSAILAIPAFIIGIVFMSLVSSSNPSRQYLMSSLGSSKVSRAEWALFIIATPVYFCAADVFHRRAIKELRALWRQGSTTPILRRFYRFGSMDMLMSFGTTIAYFSSVAELGIAATRPSEMASMKRSSSYFDSVVFLTMFLLIGRMIEAYSKAKTGDAVTMLGKLRPTEAILVTSDSDDQNSPSEQVTRQINVDLLELGDVVRVLHGGSPPCDGTVLEGESKFDESSLTGESRLVAKSIGDEVYSGTVNKDGPISIRISGVSGASMLDQIVKVVREGQTRRAPIERVADVLTSYFVPFVTLIAISTWIIWLALGLSGALPENFLDTDVGGWPLWSLQFAIAVFIIACPCGIGLAAPTALFVGGGLAAQHGILVKGGGEAFQEASGLDCIVFDKTGTLTQGGEPEITGHEFFSRDGGKAADEKTILGVLKRMEESSSHPIAKAAVSFCASREAQDVGTRRIDEIAGKGMKGSFTTEILQGQLVEAIVGNEALMAEYGVDIPSEVIKTLGSWKTQGKSIALVAVRIVPDTQPLQSDPWSLSAIFAASDPLRPEASAVIEALQHRGIDVWMISGDNPTTACAVGDMVGIARENIIAGVLPDQKAEKIQYLQRSLKKSKSRSMFGRKYEYTQQRATVAMVGDGINDSPALTIADVGIAIGSGSDIAISSAEFVLISSSLTSLLTLIDLSRAVFTRIKFNFGWALVYNLLALPVAAGVLYPVRSNGAHIRLDPVWASLAMALSSVSVICSSLLLRSRLPVIGFRPEKRILQ
ncbi:E1-E2 ATPase-domain-containing protein [Cadophora sp. MPI-SDFR-AT-0126]|nr:E1-E2 ATPase-domain-containing protein [Leotiomycetes sp. MPI-SDFR-AT-0126]